jgi:sterol 14-demethylase
MEDFEIEGVTVRAGQMVGASPWVSNRIEEDFEDPERFDLTRYLGERAEDRDNPWTWIPFGAGRHRCVGANFAMMQLKAIFSILLHEFELAPGRPLEEYRADLSKMVIQLEQPVTIHYRRRGEEVVQ